MQGLNEDVVCEFLAAHPDVLERIVTGPTVTRETFQRWSLRRASLTRKHSRKDFGDATLESRRRAILDHADNRVRILYELSQFCAQLVGTEAVELVIQNNEGAFTCKKTSEGELKLRKASFFSNNALWLTCLELSSTLVLKLKKHRKPASYVQSIINCAHQTIGELHFFVPVPETEKRWLNTLCMWASSVNYFAELSTHALASNGTEETHDNVARQRKLANFLLDVAKSIFHDIVSMDSVIIKVMNFAQKLVDADRASLFLVDAKSKEIYARIFDVGTGEEEHSRLSDTPQKEIRFDISKGIAGYVASTGEGLNIEEAYEDERFNAEVDSKTGYVTKTILCMPIFIRGAVIGVVQMVNKHTGVFTKQDEDSFEIFAVYCGLALHHAKLYDKIRRSEQKYRVALEVLAYHSVCNKDEVNKLKKIQINERVMELETFDFNGMRLSELEKPLYAVYMFRTLFSETLRFDVDDLTRFVLTVRKNYRRVAYHNWAHGWSVAHAMFVLLMKNKSLFTPNEALALFVSCLCHDLDHRGKNNAYMKTMSTPLAAIYTTSVMEHHHFNQTVTILQQDGHNILKSLTSDEYKQTLGLIKHCILATDLALFFANKARLNKIVDAGDFDITSPDHRSLTQAVLMTGCDLIASAKPWSIQTETVKVIFEEFYDQGDAERLSGKQPMAMMDRQQAHQLPQMQVGFMRGICLPCYELIGKVLPRAISLRDRCEYNATKWEELATEQKKSEEKLST
ncbi:unnamed protein product [Caenorhabditis auriculariae]|uniref:Phosphodiesterase n=1 Tax=Caenorhabditis auriculariae TaxID=2777116 RepID=A0A8S1GM98_9PELO|nr:unnamed protein product [Caenorhabditis auriculariae]